MSAFVIRPPVHLHDGRAIDTSSDAAAIVRQHAMTHCSLATSVLAWQMETIETADEAQALALQFRAWASREGLLMTRPLHVRC